MKHQHEIRDPIHVFVRITDEERMVLDSAPVQRLRHIHQLGMTYLLYPGATHRRFEHSLGVMELASRVYDVVTARANFTGEEEEQLPELADQDKVRYWRQIVRLGALLHDVGHLPFSHAAERELLPDDWDHERLTRTVIESRGMAGIWGRFTPPVRVQDLVKVAVGQRHAPDLDFTPWESIASEIIVGDAFGVDRMDYLLRDSLHLGVAYGRFDHYRLIDTLRIIARTPPSRGPAGAESETVPALGVEDGGLQTAEALALARYFMYSQVYFHPVRRAYDEHLKDFLMEWLQDGHFPIELDEHLAMTDNEVLAAIRTEAEAGAGAAGEHARRIQEHRHFKALYIPTHAHLEANPKALDVVAETARLKFGAERVRVCPAPPRAGQTPEFTVRRQDGSVASSVSLSRVLQQIPIPTTGCVLVAPGQRDEGRRWLSDKQDAILQGERE
ncbi:MAG TPA: HD domain-containing protein [Chthonomonadales bacterium]|nr:HD domain-containing protein [Chthonomonadales bacterium]